MGFIDKITECLGGAEFPKEPEFRAVLFGENAVYFENISGIISYERERVIPALKKGQVTVRGCDLYIKKYCSGDVVICGKISGIEKTDNR